MTGSLFQVLFNLVDTFYAGKISFEALSALAKAFPLYFLIVSAGTTFEIIRKITIENNFGKMLMLCDQLVRF